MDKSEEEILDLIKEFANKLPKLPDGRINYKDSPEAPVINIFLKYKNQVLLLKRSDKVLAYPNKWNSISGFLDEIKPIREKILEELKEEIGISEKIIQKINIRKIYDYVDEEIKRTWVICPVLVELNQKPNIKLDWEHTNYKWILPKDINKFNIITGLDKILQIAIK